LKKISYESKGLAREIRALIESEFSESAPGRAQDPHTLAAYQKNFEARIRIMALELYRGTELDVNRIRDATLRWLAQIRQSGGSVEETVNTIVGADRNFVL